MFTGSTSWLIYTTQVSTVVHFPLSGPQLGPYVRPAHNPH